MTISHLVFYISTGLLFFAFISFRWARRGRRIDDHPLCRRCGFDLFGKPAGSTKCSECGAELSRKRALRIGNRKSRDIPAAIALSTVILSGVTVAVAGYQVAVSTNWYPYKPLWWIEHDVSRSSGAARDAALQEVARRIGESKLTDEQVAAWTDRCLAWQADPSKPWSPAWGNVVESAKGAGKCPAEKWKRYQGQSVTFALEILGDEPRVGEDLTVRLLRGPDRVGSARFSLSFTAPASKIQIDGKAAIQRYGSRWPAVDQLDVPSGLGTTGGNGLLAREFIETESLAPGNHTVQWPVTVRAVTNVDGIVANIAVAIFSDPKFGALSSQVQAEVQLLKRDAPRVGSDQDPIEQWFQTALFCDRIESSYNYVTGDLCATRPPPAKVIIGLSTTTADGRSLVFDDVTFDTDRIREHPFQGRAKTALPRPNATLVLVRKDAKQGASTPKQLTGITVVERATETSP